MLWFKIIVLIPPLKLLTCTLLLDVLQAVRVSLRRRCRCHGTTGACQTKTCSQRIGDIKEIGDYLKKKFWHAKLARYTSKKKLQFSTTKGFRQVRVKHNFLLYMVASPDYCVKNLALGSSGLLGRVCPTNSTRSSKCSSLCGSCGLRPQEIVQQQTVKCHCKFKWCCSVLCRECQEDVKKIVCKK